MVLALQQTFEVFWVGDFMRDLRMASYLMEPVCISLWTICLVATVLLALMKMVWRMSCKTCSLQAQLEQCSVDLANLSETFGSETERLKAQLFQKHEALNPVLQADIPGHLQLISRDYWCIKTMDVVYTNKDGKLQTWQQTGYDISCFLPVGAHNLEVTFGVVGGVAIRQVDRSKPGFPWVVDAHGNPKVEKFCYQKCPCHMRYEVRGTSLHAFISHVAEMDVQTR
eukprot:CAMPEP_0172709236 /NCGR_PEP_ID=MMETSP1074-20121228/53823_1 /TAXON_ID=2916 /ORGANISM="Ceratium fusus, Strain PA161109" /LENGTH=225 /DNA_ID=CAMNT_0013532419 /DNA_START=46 /DNA_END=723 /DNA_ORIENTATION=+